MVSGFALIVALALGLLYFSQNYGNDKGRLPQDLPAENYLAS